MENHFSFAGPARWKNYLSFAAGYGLRAMPGAIFFFFFRSSFLLASGWFIAYTLAFWALDILFKLNNFSPEKKGSLSLLFFIVSYPIDKLDFFLIFEFLWTYALCVFCRVVIQWYFLSIHWTEDLDTLSFLISFLVDMLFLCIEWLFTFWIKFLGRTMRGQKCFNIASLSNHITPLQNTDVA